MFQNIKKILYFPLAYYFRFLAQIKLARWNPRVIVITGSSGKTTLLHLIESQLNENASYSHHANSSYGIPFDILGLERSTLMPYEWFELFLKAPFLIFSKVPKQKIYVVEADCDRPGEGVFLSTFLKPEVTIWLSSSRTHSMNFDQLVAQGKPRTKMVRGKFPNVEEAIAYEYGYFLEATQKLIIVNSDSDLIKKQLDRTNAKSVKISTKDLQTYKVTKSGSEFTINGRVFSFKFLLPEAVSYSISATIKLLNYLDQPFDDSFKKFELPPGRSSIFAGVKNTTIVDSCYNSNLSSAVEIISMFDKIPAKNKWAIIGDMLEQGKSEREEHEKLGRELLKFELERIVLLGPRIAKYTKPILEQNGVKNLTSFENPREVLDYLLKNLKGGEMILFKGARFLEGVIENLLADKSDVVGLSRREKIWEIRREKWGF